MALKITGSLMYILGQYVGYFHVKYKMQDIFQVSQTNSCPRSPNHDYSARLKEALLLCETNKGIMCLSPFMLPCALWLHGNTVC